MSPNNHTLDITTLETWLWEAACKIRGPVDAPKFKDYVLPLVFLIGVIDVVDFNATQAGQRKRATAGCDEPWKKVCASPPLRLCVKGIRNQRRDAERQRRRELIQNIPASALRVCARVEVARH